MATDKLYQQLETVKAMLTNAQSAVATKDYGRAITQINEAGVALLAVAVNIQREVQR